MLDFEKTTLWQSGFCAKSESADAEACSRLRNEFFHIRDRAEKLVSLIVRDIPGLTIHDISHLDALWETASLIAGEDYRLNPAEAFVFGAAVMLHDAAMSLAAFPGGLREIVESDEWRDAVALRLRETPGCVVTHESLAEPPPEIVAMVLPEILRALHARRARELPHVEWPLPDGSRAHLIRDDELRSNYGEIIGKIAESHWWPVEELRAGLPSRVNAGAGVPSRWIVDPTKVACLLRVADAAHIDHRRAPRFLHALLQPTGASGLHWTFQGMLGKPSLDHHTIVYTGASFSLKDADAWWLCFDTIRMIDAELRAVDVLLQANNRPRFAANAVQAAGSPSALREFIGTDGWIPVDTGLRVSNIPALVRLLGGERLYGSDPSVALRELIQNSADAIRVRRALNGYSRTEGVVHVALRQDAEKHWWLDVHDNGAGMSRRVLTETLLDFGKSLWRTDAVRQEFPGLISSGMEAAGRFGIGFFSVFMLGERVVVTTRRFDAAASKTLTLDFRAGLEMRPILRDPSNDEALAEAGTRISVRLQVSPGEANGLCMRAVGHGPAVKVKLADLVASICPSLDATVECSESNKPKRCLSADDWRKIPGKSLLGRVRLGADKDDATLGNLLREIKDASGNVYGRACISTNDRRYLYAAEHGIVTAGGLKAAKLLHVGGIFLGAPVTVARDSAIPLAPAAALRVWATEQATLIAASNLRDRDKMMAAGVVMAFGGDIGRCLSSSVQASI